MPNVEWGIRNDILCTFLDDFRKLLDPAEATLLEQRLGAGVATTLQYKAPEVYDDYAWQLAYKCVNSLGITGGERLNAMHRLWGAALAKADLRPESPETDLPAQR